MVIETIYRLLAAIAIGTMVGKLIVLVWSRDEQQRPGAVPMIDAKTKALRKGIALQRRLALDAFAAGLIERGKIHEENAEGAEREPKKIAKLEDER